MKKRNKENIETLESLVRAGTIELQFANICIENFYNALLEIEEKTNDPIAKKLSEIAREKHNLDKCQHARALFE